VLQFGSWVAEEVLAPVPHRQYVFTIPKMLRVYFRKDRRLLGKLSQCAVDALKTLFRAASKDAAAVPGIIEQPEVIRKILTHLGVWPAHVHSPPAGVPVAISPATGLIAAESTRHGPSAAGRRGRDPRLPAASSMRVNSS
jgi:hypothetical protein